MRKNFFRTLGIIIVVYIGALILVKRDWGCTHKINPVWVYSFKDNPYEQTPYQINMGDDSFIYFFMDSYDSLKARSYTKINKRNGQLSDTCLLSWHKVDSMGNKSKIGRAYYSVSYGDIPYFFVPHSDESFITNYKGYSISIKTYQGAEILFPFYFKYFYDYRFILRDTCEGAFVGGEYIHGYYLNGKYVLQTQKQYLEIASYMLDSTSIYLLKSDGRGRTTTYYIYRYDFEDLLPKEKQDKK